MRCRAVSGAFDLFGVRSWKCRMHLGLSTGAPKGNTNA